MKQLMGAALAVCIAVPGAAQAQQGPQCGPRADVLQVLNDQYGEARQSVAMASGGVVFEVWANAETGTWTALVTDPTGRSCIGLYGSDYQAVIEPAGTDG